MSEKCNGNHWVRVMPINTGDAESIVRYVIKESGTNADPLHCACGQPKKRLIRLMADIGDIERTGTDGIEVLMLRFCRDCRTVLHQIPMTLPRSVLRQSIDQ